MKLKNCTFCMLPERDAKRKPEDREILFENGTAYVVAPLSYESAEALLIIPKYHYVDLASAAAEDLSIAYDMALAEQWAVKRHFNTEGYWGVEHCGDAGGNSGRSQGHAHKWCHNCLPGQSTTGLGSGTLRQLVNVLTPDEVAFLQGRLRERG
jgi:diadenosine tetraphosphate (Ap4A) HIT family hydrolase